MKRVKGQFYKERLALLDISLGESGSVYANDFSSSST